jgi:hypothetical protein
MRSIQPDTKMEQLQPTHGYKDSNSNASTQHPWAGSHHGASWYGDDHDCAGPREDGASERTKSEPQDPALRPEVALSDAGRLREAAHGEECTLQHLKEHNWEGTAHSAGRRGVTAEEWYKLPGAAVRARAAR